MYTPSHALLLSSSFVPGHNPLDLVTNEQQALPFACDHTQNAVSSSLYSLVSEQRLLLCSSTACLPVQSGPVDPLCV